MRPTEARRRLRRLRSEVDRHDRELVRALARRFRAVAKIGLLKSRSGLPLESKGRWSAILSSRRTLARRLGVPTGLIDGIWELIRTESLRAQRILMRKRKK